MTAINPQQEQRYVFVVPFTIKGEVEIVASSKGEAQRQFESLSIEQLAREGELENYDPQPVPRPSWRG